MQSKDFTNEAIGLPGQRTSPSNEEVRHQFLTDFMNDLLLALNTGISTGSIVIPQQKTTATQPAAQQPNIEPTQVSEDTFDLVKKLYIKEQEEGQTISEFVEDFFSDWVRAANADYSRYNSQIKKLAQTIEQEYTKNPKGKLGFGYSKPLRTAITQLGDVALLIYRLKRGTKTAAAAPGGLTLGSVTDWATKEYLNVLSPDEHASQVVPELKLGQDTYIKTSKGWVSKSTNKPVDPTFGQRLDQSYADLNAQQQTATPTQISQPQSQTASLNNTLRQAISKMNVRQKQELINAIMKSMPIGKDLG